MPNMTDHTFDTLSTQDLGDVNISTSVLETIAIKAATDTQGVVSTRRSQQDKSNFRGFTRERNEAQVTIDEVNAITIDIYIRVAYSYSVPDVSIRVQENIKEQILYMTDLIVQTVNVHVVSIETDSGMNPALYPTQSENDGE